MRLKYVEKIKANLSIAASKKTTRLLDGLYCSIFKGQSLDFDDLRDYVVGDNSKDIDWKSSIRHGSLLVRRFVAFRRHSILFVVDTGEKMCGLTPSDEKKSTVALYALGALGYLVVCNGDEVGAIYAKDENFMLRNFRPSLSQLELILNDIDKNIECTNRKDLNSLIEAAIKNQKRRMILVVISDLKGLNDLKEELLRKVAMNHDLLFVDVEDADITSAEDVKTKKIGKKNRQSNYDIDAKSNIPKFIAGNKDFAKKEKQIKIKILNEKTAILKKYKMSVVMIGAKAKIPDKLIDLLERHNHAIRH